MLQSIRLINEVKVGSILTAFQHDSPTRDELLARWAHIAADAVLNDLPYRIELNKWGTIEMTPAANPRHMRAASVIERFLQDALPGEAFPECPILTDAGLKIADVVWCSAAFVSANRAVLDGSAAALERAPDLCVEIMSPSNSAAELREKIQFYLRAGAQEGWLVGLDLEIAVYGEEGHRTDTLLAVDLAELKRGLRARLGPSD